MRLPPYGLRMHNVHNCITRVYGISRCGHWRYGEDSLAEKSCEYACIGNTRMTNDEAPMANAKSVVTRSGDCSVPNRARRLAPCKSGFCELGEEMPGAYWALGKWATAKVASDCGITI